MLEAYGFNSFGSQWVMQWLAGMDRRCFWENTSAPPLWDRHCGPHEILNVTRSGRGTLWDDRHVIVNPS